MYAKQHRHVPAQVLVPIWSLALTLSRWSLKCHQHDLHKDIENRQLFKDTPIERHRQTSTSGAAASVHYATRARITAVGAPEERAAVPRMRAPSDGLN